MSSPSSVQSCPEPSAYSNDSFSAAEVDMSAPSTSVMDDKGLAYRFSEIDSVLSNQLGAVTNPVVSSVPVEANTAFPVLPTVNESNAIPVLSSNMGADINSSFTLLQNSSSLPTSQLGADIAPSVVAPVSSTALPNLVSFAPTSSITGPVSVAPSGPVSPIQSNVVEFAPSAPSAPSESYENVNQNKLKPSNISSFIQKTQPEHFNGGKKIKEHFSITTGSSMFDTLILCGLIGVVVYYIISPSHGSSVAGVTQNIEGVVSKVPVLSQLVDPSVSDSNKLLIVAAVVLAFIFISQLLN
jgi:hypothetical protein